MEDSVRNKKKTYNKITTMLIHGIVVITLFLLPFLKVDASTASWQLIVTIETPIILVVILFYANYFIWIDKWLFFRKQKWKFYLIQAFFILFSVLLLESSALKKIRREAIRIERMQDDDFRGADKSNQTDFDDNHDHDDHHEHDDDREGNHRKRRFPRRIHFSFMIVEIMVILSAIGIKSQQRLRQQEFDKKKSDNLLLEAKLNNLTYQVQPHFFFNTLNTIHSLIDISKEDAQNTLIDLSEMMRYVLSASKKERARLGDELSFMERYIQIMKLRLPDYFEVQEEFDIQNRDYTISPLLLIVLIENAFKHGNFTQKGSYLRLKMTQKGDEFSFEVNNSCKEISAPSTEIGLQNLKERLHLLYPEQHYFSSEKQNGNYKAILRLWKS
jgi:signal transduction histidine kinase